MNDDATELAKRFLTAVASRDIAGASACIGDDFEMVASGGQRFTTLEDFIANSQTRQRTVNKQPQSFETVETADGQVVYCQGTMSGEWLDGTEYAGVRFIDRFLVRNGYIQQLLVWSDMGEFRPA